MTEDREQRPDLTRHDTVPDLVFDVPPTEPDDVPNHKLIGLLGEGGMGEVHLAEQIEPIRRQVAIKIVKQGMETRRVIARFESERQALALMDHPNIARVLDAGATKRGRPYFAMEYVKGLPITQYCDRAKLTMRERLELFLQVCDGVQHAHQKAILHRDLKPSNILVATHDERPMPKIIDFGVAKATSQRLTEMTMYTELGQLIGTPEYMSPEQAELSAEDVDTRTDVYSLGVVLYELLVGDLPFDPTELRSAGYDEIRRRIREVDPPRPSTKFSSAGDRSTKMAKRRNTTAVRFSSQLKGDLDWIIMKALEKDRTRRYGSPSELAADIRRHLEDQPVLAGPPSFTYRTGKFVRRHRVGVAFGSIVLLLLLGFAVTMAVQAGRIARERDRANLEAERATQQAETARQVSDFLVNLFEVSNPSEARGNSITAREILDRGAERIDRELTDQPMVRATMLETIGSVYRELGLYQQSRPMLETAVGLRVDQAEDELTLASSMLELAELYDWMREAKAESLAQRAVEIRERVYGSEHPEVADGLHVLGNAIWHAGRYAEAESVHRRSMAIREATAGPDSPEVARSLHDIGSLRFIQGDLAAAEQIYLRSIEIEERTLGETHKLGTTLHTLAMVYEADQRYDAALALEQRSLAIREKTLGPDHYHVALSLTTLGTIYTATGREAEAVPFIRRAVTIAERELGPTHEDVNWMRRNLARALVATGDLTEAESVLGGSVAVAEDEGSDPNPMDVLELASISLVRGDLTLAESRYQRSIELTNAWSDEDSPYAGLGWAGLANVYREGGRVDEAEAAYRKGIELMTEGWGTEDPDRIEAVRDFATFLRLTGRTDEAQRWTGEADSLAAKP